MSSQLYSTHCREAAVSALLRGKGTTKLQLSQCVFYRMLTPNVGWLPNQQCFLRNKKEKPVFFLLAKYFLRNFASHIIRIIQ